MNPSNPKMKPDEECEDLANRLTQEGIRFLAAPAEGALSHALRCFDQAIEWRCHLPLAEHPWYRWGLTAGWMNRADVLARLGRPDEALDSYDQAIRHLQQLPLEMEPAFRWRLGLAWMNRGLALQAQGGEQTGAALASLDYAIQTLDHSSLTTARDMGTLGCAWMNRAVVLMKMEPAQSADAQEAASEALARLHLLERQDVVAAEAALKARYVYCQATATLLETPPVDSDRADAWILAAEDHVEEALVLVNLWRGQADFTELALHLFRFGCRIYLAFQPQFLGEFMIDVLRPNPERRVELSFLEVAEESLGIAAEVMRHRGITEMGPKGIEGVLETLAKLNAASDQIRAWRELPFIS